MQEKKKFVWDIKVDEERNGNENICKLFFIALIKINNFSSKEKK